MKTKLSLWLILSALTLFCKNLSAQTESPSASWLLDSIHYIYSGINPSEVQTGILFDRNLCYGPMKRHTGKSEDDITDADKWYQILFSLRNSAYDTTRFPRPDWARSIVRQYTAQNLIPIGIISTSYNILRDTAFVKGYAYFDTTQKKIFTTGIAPFDSVYRTDTVFAAAPLRREHRKQQLTFIVPQELIFGESYTQYDIKIDFQDGSGYRNVNVNQQITVDYGVQAENSVNKEISIKITPHDSSKPIHRAKGGMTLYKTAPQPDDIIFITGTGGYAGCKLSNKSGINILKATLKANSIHPWSTRTNPNFKIENPVIIVEGFDQNQDSTQLQYGRIGWENVVTADYGTTIFGEAIYPEIKKLKDLMDSLNDNGHDVILVDFQKNLDSIQRNANALVKLIQTVNLHKTGSQSLIVMGASMGGLIARVALRTMELDGCQHCAGTYITFDTPHRGANVAYGVQVFTSLFGNINDGAAERDAHVIQAPATQQMLVYQYHFAGYSLRFSFRDFLDSIGQPQQPRRLALTSGTDKAIGEGFQPGDKLLGFNYLANAFAPAAFAFIYAVGSSNGSIFDGQVVKRVHWWYPARLRITIPNSSSFLPYDNAPGGRGTFVKDVYQQIYYDSVGNASEYATSLTAPDSSHRFYPCFVPTVSALDIDTQDLFMDIQNSYVIPFGLTPFEAYHSPSTNQIHVTIDTVNIMWTMNRIRENGAPRGTPLPSKITGSTNYNYTYNYGGASGLSKDKLNSWDVYQYGILSINDNEFTRYLSDSKPPRGSAYEISTGDGCNNVIHIHKYGSFFIGQTSSATPVNTAKVTFTAGSKLILDSGAKLYIFPGSELIFNPGSELVYKKGADIQLYKSGSKLTFNGGTLRLGDSAVFNINQNMIVSSDAGGLISFSQTDTSKVNIIGGTRSKFALSGKDTQDYKLFVDQNTSLHQSGLDSFSLHSLKAKLASNSRISMTCPVNLGGVAITSTTGAYSTHRGFWTYGQAGINISGVKVEHGSYGMVFLQNIGGNSASITDLKINDCDSGVTVFGKNFSLYTNSIFQNCHRRSLATYMMDKVTIDNSKLAFTRNSAYGTAGSGLTFTGTAGSNVSISQSRLAGNGTHGADITNATLTANCSRFDSNQAAGILLNKTELIANSSSSHGSNDFLNSGIALQLANNSKLNVQHGHNRFSSLKQYPSTNNFNYNIMGSHMCFTGAPLNISDNQGSDSANITFPLGCNPTYSKTPTSTFTGCTYTGPQKTYDFSPETVQYSTDPQLNRIFSDAHRTYSTEQRYTVALESYLNLLNEKSITQPENNTLLYQSITEMTTSLTSAEHEGLFRNKSDDITAIRKVMDAQSKLLAKLPQADENYFTRFRLGFEHAHLAYRSGNLAASLSELALLGISARTDERADIHQSWCIINAEDQVRKGLLRKEDYLKAVSECSASKAQESEWALEQKVLERRGRLLIYPNPAQNSVTVRFNLASADKITIRLRSLSGAVLSEKTVSLVSGQQEYVQDVSTLAQGLYLMDVSGVTIQQTEKVSIVR